MPDRPEVTCHDCGERFIWDGPIWWAGHAGRCPDLPEGFVPRCDACTLAEPIDLDARYTLA
jgi:hypothetical protein